MALKYSRCFSRGRQPAREPQQVSASRITMEEVRPPQPKQFLLPFVAAVVDAKDVGSMLKLLQKSFPFEEEYLHLKRAKPRKDLSGPNTECKPVEGSGQEESKDAVEIQSNKRRRVSHISVLLYPKGKDEILRATLIDKVREGLGVSLHTFETVNVPALPPPTPEDAKELSRTVWPVLFRQSEKPSPEIEKEELKRFEAKATMVLPEGKMEDLVNHVAIVDTETGEVLGRGSDGDLKTQPLQTAVMRAIDARARQEDSRRAIDDDAPKRYLCLGCDAYCVYEPNVMEAMALSHSRISTVVYLRPRSTGALGSAMMLHAEPKLNHNFKVVRRTLGHGN